MECHGKAPNFDGTQNFISSPQCGEYPVLPGISAQSCRSSSLMWIRHPARMASTKQCEIVSCKTSEMNSAPARITMGVCCHLQQHQRPQKNSPNVFAPLWNGQQMVQGIKLDANNAIWRTWFTSASGMEFWWYIPCACPSHEPWTTSRRASACLCVAEVWWASHSVQIAWPSRSTFASHLPANYQRFPWAGDWWCSGQQGSATGGKTITTEFLYLPDSPSEINTVHANEFSEGKSLA